MTPNLAPTAIENGTRSALARDMTQPWKILIVDDDDSSLEATGIVLEHLGYSVEIAHNAHEALALFEPEKHSLVLTDNRMPSTSGEALAVEIKARSPQTPVVIYSAWAVKDSSNADWVLRKPASIHSIEGVLCKLVKDWTPMKGCTPSSPES
jgi:CheY-like chemotaxis protein